MGNESLCCCSEKQLDDVAEWGLITVGCLPFDERPLPPDKMTFTVRHRDDRAPHPAHEPDKNGPEAIDAKVDLYKATWAPRSPWGSWEPCVRRDPMHSMDVLGKAFCATTGTMAAVVLPHNVSNPPPKAIQNGSETAPELKEQPKQSQVAVRSPPPTAMQSGTETASEAAGFVPIAEEEQPQQMHLAIMTFTDLETGTETHFQNTYRVVEENASR